ncbi:MAG: hypothetical protein GYA15_05365 [Leptolinea sp.]|jgi:FdhD protein|nr:hypothetical protein [Leptolinea sp.]
MEETHYLIDSSLVINDSWQQQEKLITIEHIVSLTINGKIWLYFGCTPTDLEALAIGFLFNNFIIDSMNEVACIYVCENKTNVDVWLHHSAEKPEQMEFVNIDNVLSTEYSFPVMDRERSPVECQEKNIAFLYKDFIKTRNLSLDSIKDVFYAVLYSGNKRIGQACDIEKKQTLDKLSGQCLLQSINIKGSILITNALINGEMMQKAARMGVSKMISLNSASTFALEYAKTIGIRIIGYVHQDHYSILI